MSTDHGSPLSPPLPPEPQTPAWLTALGAGLFLFAAMWWTLSALPSGKPAAPAAATAPSAAGSAAAPH